MTDIISFKVTQWQAHKLKSINHSTCFLRETALFILTTNYKSFMLLETEPYSTAKYFAYFYWTQSIKKKIWNNMFQSRHGKWNRSSQDTEGDNHHVNIQSYFKQKNKLQLPFWVRLLLNTFLVLSLTGCNPGSDWQYFMHVKQPSGQKNVFYLVFLHMPQEHHQQL